MNINEATKSEKLEALISEISNLDESAIDAFLVDYFGWDDKDSENSDLETDTKD